MSPSPQTERHRRLEELFLTAVDLPADERSAFLERACADDPRLREEIRELLGYADDPRVFLDPDGRWDARRLEPGLPERIGGYRILEPLGEGGMGIVYLAAQEEPVQRKVALKVIRTGMATPEVLARFEVERQALARMNHDFVARVYDTGVTGRVQPWFAMEYVDGPPLDRYCDRCCLGVPARLQLFVRVCEGVQHAHQKGILHRDIKPSNVLVSVQGERSVPKVIDFGLARSVDPTATAWGAQTVVGSPLGTPGFMSPEQGRGESVDTRTDIYSLGVLLHQLLVGDLPPASGEARRPSTSLRARSSAEAAAKRSTSVTALQRELRSGLDWVVLKASDPDPERRYSSVSELAADVRRHLNHEPVLAGPPNALYRFRKYARRHRYSMTASLLVLGVAVVGLMAWLAQAREAVLARDLAQAVNDYLVEDLLERARPEESLGRKITVEEVFREAAAKVDERFAGQPLQEAAVRAVIRDTFGKLGLMDAALEQAEKCYELRAEHLGPRHRDTLTAAMRLGDLWIAGDEFERGEAMLERAVQELTELYGAEDPDTLEARLALGAHWTFHGKAAEGEAELRAVVEARQRLFGAEDPRTLEARARLSQGLSQRQQFVQVVPLERKLLATRRRVLGELHPDTLTSLNNLAFSLVCLDRLDEALAVYEELVPKSLQVRGRNRTHAVVLNNYGNCLQRAAVQALKAGDLDRRSRLLDEAEAILAENLELRREVYGHRHNKTATAINNLAIIHVNRKQFDQAIPLFEEALDIEREHLGDNGRMTLSTWLNLAATLRQSGDLEAALSTFQEMLEKGAEGLSGQTVTRGVVHAHYGRLLMDLGRHAEAETELLAGYRDLREHLGIEHSRTRDALRHLVEVYEALGRDEEAERWRARLDEASGDR